MSTRFKNNIPGKDVFEDMPAKNVEYLTKKMLLHFAELPKKFEPVNILNVSKNLIAK